MVAEHVLYLYRLSSAVNEDDLVALLSAFTINVDIIRDAENGVSLEYGFVEFQSLKERCDAESVLDNRELRGEKILYDSLDNPVRQNLRLFYQEHALKKQAATIPQVVEDMASVADSEDSCDPDSVCTEVDSDDEVYRQKF